MRRTLLGSRWRRPLALSLTAVVLAAWIGCGHGSAKGGAGGTVTVPAVATDTPEDAARSLLLCLQAHLRAVAEGDQDAAQQCLAQAGTLLDVPAIQRAYERRPNIRALVGGELVEGVVENWAAAIAYYAGLAGGNQGFHFEQMSRQVESPTRVAVLVPASGPNDKALIRVTCTAQPDRSWRLVRVEFATGAQAAPPASQPEPGSQPASGMP